MKIALIGATGFVGRGLLSESLARGHQVTAIVRDPHALAPQPNLTSQLGDLTNTSAFAVLLKGHDIVISAFNPGKDEGGIGPQLIVNAVKRAGVKRLLVVGGAGTLEVAPGKRAVDQPDFPPEWKDGALKTAAFLDLLRSETELDWVFLSPAAILAPGERTGTYRVGGDQMMFGADGKSRISIADYAVAMLDEAETPEHHRQRFSAAY